MVCYMSGTAAALRGAGKENCREVAGGVIVQPGETEEACGQRLPVFYPASPAEAYRMAASAVRYAGTYGTPVMLRLDEVVREGIEPVPALSRRETQRSRGSGVKQGRTAGSGAAGRPAASTAGRAEGSAPGRAAASAAGRQAVSAAGAALRHADMQALSQAFSDSAWNPSGGSGRKGILTAGPMYRMTKEILNGYGGVRVMKLGTLYPFPEEAVRGFLSGLSACLILDTDEDLLTTGAFAVKGRNELSLRMVPAVPCRAGLCEEAVMRSAAGAVLDFIGEEAVRHGARALLRARPIAERTLCDMPCLPGGRAAWT